ncbi:hypothetical protein S83_052865 [Arachis hypogaea]|nr:uncharacterized protein DS421_15g521140 [Arachis hypogaea]
METRSYAIVAKPGMIESSPKSEHNFLHVSADCETESDNIDTEKDIYWWCGWGSTGGNKCKNKNGSSGGGSISVPPFGLATYKMQEDLWLNPEPCEYERISYLYSAADSWLKQLNVYHHDFNFFTQHPTPTTL